jgi:hypothetical protein
MRLLRGANVQMSLYWSDVYVCVPQLRRPLRMMSFALVHDAMNWMPLWLGGCGHIDCLMVFVVFVWFSWHVPCIHCGQVSGVSVCVCALMSPTSIVGVSERLCCVRMLVRCERSSSNDSGGGMYPPMTIVLCVPWMCNCARPVFFMCVSFVMGWSSFLYRMSVLALRLCCG